ncbi:MAG: hypothetical protein RLP44_29660 [Aggregatilineales bacterium]
MATLHIVDEQTWKQIATTYKRLLEQQASLENLLNTQDISQRFSPDVLVSMRDEVRRISDGTDRIIKFLKETPFYDLKVTREQIRQRKDILNQRPSVDQLSNIPIDQTELQLREYRKLYVQLLDLQREVSSSRGMPRQTPRWLIIVGIVAATMIVLVIIHQGMMAFLYGQGENALNENNYTTAVSRFSMTYRFGFNYRDSDVRLAQSYENEIRTLINNEQFVKARESGKDYFDVGVDDSGAISALHNVYIGEAQTISESLPEDDVLTVAQWETVAQPIIDLHSLFELEIRPELENRITEDNPRTNDLRSAQLNSQEINLLEITFLERAEILSQAQEWSAIRQMIAEDNLLFSWQEFPRLRIAYLGSLQDEVQVVSASDPPQWDVVEQNVLELLGLIDETEIFDYMPARIILAARYVDEAIVLRDAIPEPITDGESITVDLAAWETVREKLAEANDLLADEAVQAFFSRVQSDVNFDTYIPVEEYQSARSEIATALSADDLSELEQANLTVQMSQLISETVVSFTNDSYYSPAEIYFDAENYTEAQPLYAEVFQVAPGFRNTRERYYNTFYIPAVAAFDIEEYSIVRELFANLIDEGGETFEDTASLYRSAFYIPAVTAFENNDTETAVNLLRILYNDVDENYRDTALLLTQGLFTLGVSAIDEARFEDAERYLEEIQLIDADYQDLRIRLSQVYYSIATTTLSNEENPDRFQEAREVFLQIEELNANYRDTASLIRETYYQPILIALAPMEETPDAETCTTIREDINAFIEIDPQAVDYREMRLLTNETYYCEARSFFIQAQAETNPALREATFEEARQSIEALGIDSNYKDVNNLIVQTFYIPATEYYRTALYDEVASERQRTEALEQARDLLNRLREDNDLFYVFYQDAWILLRNTYYAPAFRAFTVANDAFVSSGDTSSTQQLWEDARELTQELLTLDRNYVPPQSFTPPGETIAFGALLEAESLPSADTLYAETYYIPAQRAYTAQDWTTARGYLSDLLAFDPLYRDAAELLLNSYWVQGEQASVAGEWATAQTVLNPLVNLDPNYRPEYDSQPAFTLLANSYAIPAGLAYESASESYESASWETVFSNLVPLVELAPDYSENLPSPALRFLHEAYYQRAVMAEEAARNAELNSQEAVDAWQITKDSLVNLLLLDADPEVSTPNLLSDIINPYRDAQDRLRDVFHQLAASALLIGDWQRARITSIELLFIDPTDTLANEQLRESFYLSGEEALNVQDYDTARQEFTDLLLLDGSSGATNPFDTETPYRGSDALLLDAYHDQAQAHLDANEWRAARAVAGELLAFLPDDEVSNIHLRESFYSESVALIEAGEWENARSLLSTLIRLDNAGVSLSEAISLDNAANWRDSAQQFRITFYRPAEEALNSGNFGIARDLISDLLEIVPDDGQANNIVIDSYLLPAQNAFDTGNWGIARDTIDDMFSSSSNVLLTNGDRYGDAVRLYMLAYLQPADIALDSGDWIVARANSILAITIGTRFGNIGDQATPNYVLVQDLLEESRMVFGDAYFQPVDQSLTEADWITARDILAELQTYLEQLSETERIWYPAFDDVEAYLLDTYSQPVEQATNNGDLGAARTALIELQSIFPGASQTIAQLNIRLFNVPLADAINAQDWASAADLFTNLKNQPIRPLNLDTILIDFPRLRDELALRNVDFWRADDVEGRIYSLTPADFPVADVLSVAVSTSGTRAYIADSTGIIYVFNIRLGAVEFIIDTATRFITDIVVDPAGLWIATLHDDGIVRIWGAENGQPLATVQRSDDRIMSMALSVDGSLLATGTENTRIVSFWTPDDWTTPVSTLIATIPITGLSLSPDNTQLTIVGDEQWALHDVDTGTMSLVTDTNLPFTHAEYRPDSDAIALFGYSPNVTIVDANGDPVRTFTGHTDWVRGAVFVGIDDLLATLGADGRFILWDPQSGLPVNVIEEIVDGAFDFSISIDGNVIVVGGANGQIQVFRVG